MKCQTYHIDKYIIFFFYANIHIHSCSDMTNLLPRSRLCSLPNFISLCSLPNVISQCAHTRLTRYLIINPLNNDLTYLYNKRSQHHSSLPCRSSEQVLRFYYTCIHVAHVTCNSPCLFLLL